ncbi:MAG: ATP-binding protein [Chloroflexota bacterium]|nr:ATP-binding protein [Chloroflexota bacterium]
MTFLRDLIELITVPPGDLVYLLVSLFVIQLILGITSRHWHRSRHDPAARRLLAAGVGLFLTRTLLMLIAVLDRAGVLSPDIVLPPLERFLDLATLLLTIWAFLPILERHSRLGMAILLLALLVSTGVYVAFAALWPEAEAQSIAYNGYWQETVWESFSIAILVLTIVASFIWRENDWGLLVWLSALWLTGHILQLAIPFADSHTAGWVRLANLAVLPLIASIVHRRVLSVSPVVSRDDGLGLGLIGILEATQYIETTPDTEAALRMSASSIAHVLGADMIAIGVLAPGLAKKIRIVALHPSTGTMLAHQEPTLLVSRHPMLATAIQTGSLQHESEPAKDPTVVALYHHLGFERPGPSLAQPIVDEGTLLGIILAGNPFSQRQWTIRDEQIFQAVGAAITTALVNASRREAAVLSTESQKALDEAERLAQRASELEAELETQRQRAEELATKLRLREQSGSAERRAIDEAAVWQEEMRNLAEANLQNQAALEAELAEWKERTKHLTHLKDDLETQLAQIQARFQEVQSQTEASASYKQISQDIPDSSGILMSDGQGNIILANQRARYLIGQHRSSPVGISLQTLFADTAWSEAVNKLSHDETQVGDTVAVTLDLDGQGMQVELTRLPSVAEGPGPLVVMLYPEEGVFLQSGMASSLVHDLRTPMTSITSYVNLLLGESVGILGEMQRQLLQRVNANIERINGLLEDLVKVTTIDPRQASLLPESVDLLNVIENVITSLSAQCSERQVSVQVDILPDLPLLSADRDSLYQIILRLLSNACQCSEPGTNVLVHARLEEYDDPIDDLPDYLFMSVADTGGGIAPEDQRRIFQRLYRANNPLIAGLGDTGVGLSIARALVETQGGRIWVESEMGVGSTFSFILPLSPEDDPGDNGSRLAESPSLSSFPTIPSHPLRGEEEEGDSETEREQ